MQYIHILPRRNIKHVRVYICPSDDLVLDITYNKNEILDFNHFMHDLLLTENSAEIHLSVEFTYTPFIRMPIMY